jgi:hypothetical protein
MGQQVRAGWPPPPAPVCGTRGGDASATIPGKRRADVADPIPLPAAQLENGSGKTLPTALGNPTPSPSRRLCTLFII